MDHGDLTIRLKRGCRVWTDIRRQWQTSKGESIRNNLLGENLKINEN
jgi:hypothetical protein